MSVRKPTPDKELEDWFLYGAFAFLLVAILCLLATPLKADARPSPRAEITFVDDGYWFAVDANQSPLGYRLLCVGSTSAPDTVICVPAKNGVVLNETPA